MSTSYLRTMGVPALVAAVGGASAIIGAVPAVAEPEPVVFDKPGTYTWTVPDDDLLGFTLWVWAGGGGGAGGLGGAGGDFIACHASDLEGKLAGRQLTIVVGAVRARAVEAGAWPPTVAVVRVAWRSVAVSRDGVAEATSART